MPDLQSFAITPLASANVNVPRFQIACQVLDSRTGAVIADFTGANALTFPGVLTQLTAQQRRDLLDHLAIFLVRQLAGLG